MFARIRRLLGQFFTRSRTINNEPLNKVSLIVIILVDIFILINVFTGLDDISRWYLNPSQVYPCYAEWKNYRTQTNRDKDYEIIKLSLSEIYNSPSFQRNYQQIPEGHLGKVSELCLNYAGYKDKIYTSENRQTITTINQKQANIGSLERANRNIRAQYDSTLLEKLAGQPREQSINQIAAEKAKQTLDQNINKISILVRDISNLKNQLITKSESVNFLNFLKDESIFSTVERGYQQASFWYPSIQFAFQAIFLLPLILIALLVHRFAGARGYGLISLISWHLLVIFFIPLILKIFEFLQFGALFQFLFDIIAAIFGGLLFLISYIYILLIPLIGFGLIKFFQKVIFNSKLQAANRVQKSRCIKCAKKIRHSDIHCSHCGYHQYTECPNCHNFTYKHLPYCRECGHSQNSSHL
ncbi:MULTISPECIES: membrane protein [Nostocales]|uniref:Membrane protein n=3 Tax=Nostocales TaxID=1161 RepID=A0A0C1QTB0_9CYAN|nr:membrane protein [Tolypothrix bouteillei]KAF3883980.1 hypothetical protein DA73_0400040535 [Tolypothrix bouteillei VB521301]